MSEKIPQYGLWGINDVDLDLAEEPLPDLTTDQRRIEEFADTGNPSYLTPALAHQMALGFDIMKEVPGATETDLEIAHERQVQQEARAEEMIDHRNSYYGLDQENLQELRAEGPKAYLEYLLQIASQPVSLSDFEERDDDRDTGSLAETLIKDFILEDETHVADLFSCIHYYDASGVHDIQLVKELFKNIHQDFMRLGNTPDLSDAENIHGRKVASVLNAFASVTEHYLEADTAPADINYLTDRFFHNFCLERKFTEPATTDNEELPVADAMFGLERMAQFDRDTNIPFPIEKNKLALFSVDKRVLYVVDGPEVPETSEQVKNLRSQITYEVAGQYFARRIMGNVPEQLLWIGEDIYDAGTPVEAFLTQGDGTDPALVRDFLYLQQADMRETIETDFGIQLQELSIKEQLYFLQYLQHTTLGQAETMQSFTSLYGVDGMRTFLSLERGDESLGNNIVAFGQHDEVAGTVFKYYGELLNSAERAEALVKEVSDCEGEACAELASQVRENIVNRAQKDLEKAVRAHDPSEVLNQIENYVAAAKEYVALLQEVGTGKIEHINSSELSTAEQDHMKILMKANYDKAYPGTENEEFKAAVAGSLEKSFDNLDTSFRVLRDNEKIVSYNRFDTIHDNTGKEVSYFGSFNADPAYSGVGGVMLEETIKDQLETGRPMMAHCDPSQAITRKYIEDGFVATGFYELAGKPSFEIWRSKDSSTELESKERSVEELLESIDESGAMVVREQSESDIYPELQNNMGLTRFFNYQGKTYLVFEKLPHSLQEKFTNPHQLDPETEAA